MRAVFVTTAIILASTSVATAGTVEQNCWKRITEKMIANGCAFGNDLSVASNECENRRRAAYKRCVMFVSTQHQIGPIHRTEFDRPVLRIQK